MSLVDKLLNWNHNSAVYWLQDFEQIFLSYIPRSASQGWWEDSISVMGWEQ